MNVDREFKVVSILRPKLESVSSPGSSVIKVIKSMMAKLHLAASVSWS